MKKAFITIFAFLLVFLLAAVISITIRKSDKVKVDQKDQQISPKTDTNMRLTSHAFNDNSNIPKIYTCDGDDINPPLTISDIPTNAKSVVLIVDDPDAPAGIWVHWVVWNIDPNIRQIEETQIPRGGTQGLNDFGKLNYAGPCPPTGVHRYQFKLYALDAILEIPDGSTKEAVEAAMRGHILAQTVLTGLYSRNK